MEKTKDWRNVVTKSTDSLSKGIKVLHDGALRIALVVGQDKKLLGTLTDGDVRRALIKNMPMDTVITSVMNAHPTTVSTNIQKKEIIALMESNDLLHMPVLNENSELCDLITLQQLHKNPIYENAPNIEKLPIRNKAVSNPSRKIAKNTNKNIPTPDAAIA